MSACPCCTSSADLEPLSLQKETRVSHHLFNWVTVILVFGWVGIVTMAFELAGARNMTAVPTLEAFLKTLL